MTVLRSRMTQLGRVAEPFVLPDIWGNRVSIGQVRGDKGLLVAFICNHCPYVAHIREAFVEVARQYVGVELGFVAINSNDAEHFPDDDVTTMREFAGQFGFPFPYLIDAHQSVAASYGAVCTPDLFLHDDSLRLVYRGQFDDSRPGNGRPATGHDLRAALDAVLLGVPVPSAQYPSQGCNIKWRPGNEPAFDEPIRSDGDISPV